MRHKSMPSPSRPRKRQRPPLHRVWAYAEWFESFVDAPYFAHSDFLYVMRTALQLPPLFPPLPTRLQLSRIRAAMCHAFPGGFATPRRLSAAFLDAEIKELHLYRQDARLMMRGKPLDDAVDPSTSDPLPQDWWSRYRCPPPLPPQRDSPVLVRTVVIDISDTGSDAIIGEQTSVRRATFISLHNTAECLVRFEDDAVTSSVSDMDVMLPLQSSSPEPPNSPLRLNYFRSSASLSPQSFPFPNSPLDFDFSRIDAPSQLIDILSSPRPTIISPQRPLEVRSQSGKHVECELDVQQTAESMRLLDQKQRILLSIRDLNNIAEDATRDTPSVDQYKRLFQQLEAVNADLHQVMQPEPQSSRLFSGPPFPQPKFDLTPERKPASSGLQLWSSRQSPSRAPSVRSIPSNESSYATAMRPENRIDFESHSGAALLAQAVTRNTFASLPIDCHLRYSSANVRADVMECISTCVAVLIRARESRDASCVEEMIDSMRLRFPQNADAINAVHDAARSMYASSSASM